MFNCGRNCGRCLICRLPVPLFVIVAYICVGLVISMAPYVIAAGLEQNVGINAQVNFGLQSVYPETLLQYQEPTTTKAQFTGSSTITIDANTQDNTIDTAALFPGIATPIVIGFQDVTLPGVSVSIGTSADDTHIPMAEGGFFLYRVASGRPTFYVDNDTDEDAHLRVIMMGQ